MHEKIQQIVSKREREFTTADFIRAALHQQLDQQVEILGSKAHQVRTFQQQAERLSAQLRHAEGQLRLLMAVNLHLLLLVSAVVMGHIKAVEHGAAQAGAPLARQPILPQTLLDHALRLATGGEGRETLRQIAEAAANLSKTQSDRNP
jgi:hypothetical protein